MNRTVTRFLSLLLVLVMLLSLSPAVFAEDAGIPAAEESAEATQELREEQTESEAAEETVGDTADELLPEENSTEEQTEAVSDADEPSEETPAAEEPTEASPDAVKLTFVFSEEFRVALPADGDFIAASKTEDEEIWRLEFSLLPGSYTYHAQAMGHKDSEAIAVEIPEGSEDITICLELEEYPYGLEGMELSFDIGGEVLESKNFLTENDVPNLVAGLTPNVDYVDGEVYFLAETEEYALEVASAFGAELVSLECDVAVIRLPEGLSVAQAVEASADKNLRLPAVDPNYIVKLDDPEPVVPDEALEASFAKAPTQSWLEWKSKQGNNADPFLRNPADRNYQYNHEILNTYESWAVTTGKSNIKVVVIDTGIDLDHPDLKITGASYYSTDYTSAADDDDHGSNCAGIIAARMGNGVGGAGIAPGVSLYAYKSLGTDGGSYDAITAGFSYAKSIGADIISASLGGYFPDNTQRRAILDAVNSGITVVVAAGNDGSNIMCYPGAYDIPGLICVGAADRANKQCYFSNYGSWVDILAPGENIYSCNKDGGYSFMSGTSQATPAVAGVCALYMSMYGHRQVSPAEMEKVIKSSKTNGVLDAYKVISKGYSKAVNLGFRAASFSLSLSDRYAESSSIPQNVALMLSNDTLGNGEYIAYTLDGTTPGCIDGELVNGTVYDGNGISLESFNPGDELTLTARCIAPNGEEALCLSRSFTVAERKDFTAITLAGPTQLKAEEKSAFKVYDCFGEDITALVSWTVTLDNGTVSENVKIDKDGFISYPADMSGRAVISASAENGATASGDIEFINASLAPVPVSSVVISAKYVPTSEAVSKTYDKNGNLKSVLLYNADYVNTTDITENVVRLSTNVSAGYASWTSSNTKVATVDQNGKVTAVGQGNANITCIANDGSKKKAAVKITVKVPASSVTISSKSTAWIYGGDRDDDDGYDTNEYILAIGKSAANTAVLGDAYGKPTDKKVIWLAHMYAEKNGNKFQCANGYDYFSISPSGKLTVKSSIKELSYMRDDSYKVFIEVSAYANTDGYSATSNKITYIIQWPTTEVACVEYYGSYAYYYRGDYLPAGGYGIEVEVWTIANDKKYCGSTYTYPSAFTVSSSNPQIAGALITGSDTFTVLSGQKKGTATITVKAIDGTNKSFKFKVKVY